MGLKVVIHHDGNILGLKVVIHCDGNILGLKVVIHRDGNILGLKVFLSAWDTIDKYDLNNNKQIWRCQMLCSRYKTYFQIFVVKKVRVS